MAYQSSWAKQPEFTAVEQALETAVPTSLQYDGNDALGTFATATGTEVPTWFSALPTSVQGYLSSVRGDLIHIVTNNAEGPAPTNAAKMAGVVIAAGGAALAML